MSLAILFRPDKHSQVGSLILDATMSAEHTLESEVTDFPVEDGVNVSDHIWPKPRRFKIEGFITNSPVLILGTLFRRLGNADTENGKVVGPAINYVQVAYKILEDMHLKRELITVSTGLATYTDMAIESITIPVSPTQGDSLQFQMTVKKVVKVRSQFVMVQIKKPRAAKAKPKVDKGPQTPAALAATEPNVSILKSLLSVFK